MRAYKRIALLLIAVLFSAILIACEEKVDPATCDHEYDKGVCTICGYKCNHPIMEDDICQICGVALQDICEHEFEKGVCEICGKKCEHEHVTHGVCDVCNMNIQNYCHHTFENGVCTRCEYECLHEVLNERKYKSNV